MDSDCLPIALLLAQGLAQESLKDLSHHFILALTQEHTKREVKEMSARKQNLLLPKDR